MFPKLLIRRHIRRKPGFFHAFATSDPPEPSAGRCSQDGSLPEEAPTPSTIIYTSLGFVKINMSLAYSTYKADTMSNRGAGISRVFFTRRISPTWMVLKHPDEFVHEVLETIWASVERARK
jgi:hypothetical protein